MDTIFTTSSPETRPAWCDSVGTWRVQHADRLAAELGPRCYVTGHSKTPSGRLQLFAGIKDSRTAQERHKRAEALLVSLKARGLKVKRSRYNGLTDGVIVTDRGQA